MADIKTTSGTVPSVTAGTTAKTFTIKTVAGSRSVAESLPLFPAGKVVDLTDEGPLTFVDVAEKGQVERKMKLEETPRAHRVVLFFSKTEKKYGGLVACRMCGDAVRKWTSDMHQSFYCGGCTVKAKRAASKAKRAAKADDKE